jgi:glycosyltransferase involved in cell wall biosynthesis
VTISVALCSFNGERFIGQQLESIASQSVEPFEVVICDDGSTDGTLEIVAAHIKRRSLPIRLFVNQRRLGTTANFGRAIAECRGETIVLCDQDDVWLPDRLSVVTLALNGRPDVDLVFTDAQLVDEHMKPLPYTLWQAIGLGQQELEALAGDQGAELLLRKNFATGATLAFRSTMRPLILPIPQVWIHDWWLAVNAALYSRIAAIQQTTIMYRQHGGNQIGLARVRGKTRPSFAGRDDKWLVRMHSQSEALVSHLTRAEPADRRPSFAFARAAAQQRLVHCARRLAQPGSPWRALGLANELLTGRYHRYSSGTKSFLKDLLFPAATDWR